MPSSLPYLESTEDAGLLHTGVALQVTHQCATGSGTHRGGVERIG